jgi:hypothetical protein
MEAVMHRTRVITVVSVLACSSLLAAAGTASGQVKFKSGVADLPVLDGPAARLAAVQDLAGRAEQRVVVQFDGPLSVAKREALARAGLVLQSYVGDHAYFAKIAAGADAQNIAAERSLRSLAPIQVQWKLDPKLTAAEPPFWAVVDDRDPENPVVGVYVLFHPDAPMGLAAVETVRRHGGVVRTELMTMPALVVELPASNIAALAAEPDVQWVEAPLPPMTDLALRNDSNRERTGADIVQAAPYNLDGSGITVFVFDGGRVRATHEAFGGRVTVIDNSSQSSHSTHVAGTIGGNGPSAAGQLRKGMAPGVTLLSAGLSTSGQGIFLYSNPSDLETDYNTAINSHDADIANNSIGTNTETNGFPCSIQGDYGLVDSIIDGIVRGSLGRPFRVVWANGNERQGSRCDIEGFGDYYSVAPPAGAKNHLTVGALNSNDDSMTSFSSWGPTDDGRMKPDVSAPGCQSGGDNGVTSATSTSDTSYGANCGTSMASPTVCGLAALVLQDFRANFPGMPDPRNSTLRALFAHTAEDVLEPGPDYRSGYGSVRIQPAIDLLRVGRLQEDSVDQGDVFTTQIQATAGVPLKVTLAWDDPPATPNAATALVNDLDLRLIDPNGQVHLPWTLDPQNPSLPAVRTAPNRRDNIEQVYVENPTPGIWTVEVVGFNVPEGPQVFSIVGAGVLSGLVIEPTLLPEYLPPGQPFEADVLINVVNQDLVPNSVMAHYRYDGGEFNAVPMADLGGGLYRATLPPPSCGNNVEVYYSATGTASGTRVSPPSAPNDVFTAQVGLNVTNVHDTFETNTGWTVINTPSGTGTFTGAWERAIPIPATGAPPADVDPDGAGYCFVTGNGAGNFDLDNGTTTLISPPLDATGGEATVSYWRWFYNANGQLDTLLVELSPDNGATWHVLENVGPSGADAVGGWRFASHVLPPEWSTNQVRLRFTTSDLGTQAIVEAAIDSVKITTLSCNDPVGCPADWNGDAQVNSSDISAFLTSWLDSINNNDLNADFDGSGSVNSSDISAFLSAWLQALQGNC